MRLKAQFFIYAGIAFAVAIITDHFHPSAVSGSISVLVSLPVVHRVTPLWRYE